LDTALHVIFASLAPGHIGLLYKSSQTDFKKIASLFITIARANGPSLMTTSKLCKLKSYSVVAGVGVAVVCLSIKDILGNTFRKC
jgi:hypothetical protein